MDAACLDRWGGAGERVDRYTLLARLETGGMAEILVARMTAELGFEKIVAIKRILPHLACDDEFVQMFHDEARIVSRISHPNVCQVFDFCQTDETYFLTMEYLEGVTVKDVFEDACAREDPVPPRIVGALIMQACEGLHAAHELRDESGRLLGVVHRDVSPTNLFITVDGLVKVLDFGIAKAQGVCGRTRSGMRRGKAAYMSPEQARGEPLDRRSDVFALGTLSWELFAGKRLFYRDNDYASLLAVISDPIPRLAEARSGLPDDVHAVISRALKRARRDRFASARTMEQALRRAVASLGGAATAPEIARYVQDRFSPIVERRRELIATAQEQQDDDESPTARRDRPTGLSAVGLSGLIEQIRTEDSRTLRNTGSGSFDDESSSVSTSVQTDVYDRSSLEDDSALGSESRAESQSGGLVLLPAISTADEPANESAAGSGGLLATSEVVVTPERAVVAPGPVRSTAADRQPSVRLGEVRARRRWIGLAAIALGASVGFLLFRHSLLEGPAQKVGAADGPGDRAGAGDPEESAVAAPGLQPTVAALEGETAADRLDPDASDQRRRESFDEPRRRQSSSRDERRKAERDERETTRSRHRRRDDGRHRARRSRKDRSDEDRGSERKRRRSDSSSQKPEHGFLTVVSKRPSVVFVDGDRIDEAPLLEHRLPVGRHRLVVVEPDGSRTRRRVRIGPGDTKKVRVGWSAQR